MSKDRKQNENGLVNRLMSKELIFGVLVILSVAMMASVGVASATTIYVPDDYPTIQAAVNAANEGDLIIVRDETYTENVNVNKRLTIQSENGYDSTIVQAASSNDHVFEVTADYVNLSGFTVKGATVTNRAGIYLGSGVDYCNVISNNASNNYYGIHLYYSSNNAITSNNASNDHIGIRLSYSSNNIITDNTAKSNTDAGINLWSSTNNIITNNNASKNERGVTLGYSNNNTVTNNTADSNNVKTSYGIDLSSSNNNTIANNTASNNYYGINLCSSNNNIITNNNVSNNRRGFYVQDSNDNIVASNTANSNTQYGINLGSTRNNKIYLNNFINNADNVYSFNSTNIWNSTEEITYIYNGNTYTNYTGNYWSDYFGSDADGDGIGDTPYGIDSDKDYYPLMEPFEHYIPAEVKPTVSISTDKITYTTSDTMTITIDIANPTEESVMFQWYWAVPQFSVCVPVMSAPIPAGYDDTYDFSFIIPNWGSTPFGNVFYVRLLDTTGEVLDTDVTWWAYSPGGEAMPAKGVDIAKEIKKIIERIELQS